MLESASRTKRTLQNSRTSFVLFLIQLAVGFYSRKVFIDYLGAEILGLNTTLGNILSFLNLAEMGIGTAMATSLYRPIQENNQLVICEIISVQGLLYKRIALFLGILGVGVLAFIPWLFPETECGLTYVYVSFLVFFSDSIMSYLWNYRSILISADQKDFKLQPWIHCVRYVKIGMQIVCLTIIGMGVWAWIFWELIGNIATVFVINIILHRHYPWLKNVNEQKKLLLRKYDTIVFKTKQLFVHKIGSFVLDQTAPIIIYAFVSLTMVTYYGNYMMLVGYAILLTNSIFSNLEASVGNLVAEFNQQHTIDVFWELFSSRIWIASIVSFGLYLFASPFISIWLGEQYLLGETTVFLLVVTVFIRLSRTIVDSFKNAFQLFGDVWSPVIEAIINLGGSVLLGYLWGLNGILTGSVLSLIVIVLIWKPLYLFKVGLNVSPLKYFIRYFQHIIILFFCAYFTIKIVNFEDVLLCLIIKFIFFTVLSYVIFFLTIDGMKRFTKRVIVIIKNI